jgi:hypothetical protein
MTRVAVSTKELDRSEGWVRFVIVDYQPSHAGQGRSSAGWLAVSSSLDIRGAIDGVSPSLPEVGGVSVIAARSLPAAAGLYPRSRNRARQQPGIPGRFRTSRTGPTSHSGRCTMRTSGQLWGSCWTGRPGAPPFPPKGAPGRVRTLVIVVMPAATHHPNSLGVRYHASPIRTAGTAYRSASDDTGCSITMDPRPWLCSSGASRLVASRLKDLGGR